MFASFGTRTPQVCGLHGFASSPHDCWTCLQNQEVNPMAGPSYQPTNYYPDPTIKQEDNEFNFNYTYPSPAAGRGPVYPPIRHYPEVVERKCIFNDTPYDPRFEDDYFPEALMLDEEDLANHTKKRPRVRHALGTAKIPKRHTSSSDPDHSSIHTGPRPPRPMNSFMLFKKHRYKSVAATLPRQGGAEVAKLIARQWHDKPDEVKRYWHQAAEEEKERHRQLYPGYRYQPRRPGTAPAPVSGRKRKAEELSEPSESDHESKRNCSNLGDSSSDSDVETQERKPARKSTRRRTRINYKED